MSSTTGCRRHCRPVVTDGLLRKEMKFPGVIVTDDLEMKAVAERFGPEPAAVLAAKAGCDLLPVCKSPDAQVDVDRSARPRGRGGGDLLGGHGRRRGSDPPPQGALRPALSRSRPEGRPAGRGARRAPALAEQIAVRGGDQGLSSRREAAAALRPGDLIGICAPAGPVDSERLQRGAAELRAPRLRRPRSRGDRGPRTGFTAGSVERRLDELHGLFADDGGGRDRLRARRGGRGMAAAAASTATCCGRIPSRSSATATSPSCTSTSAASASSACTDPWRPGSWRTASYDRASFLARPDRRGRRPTSSEPDDLEPLREGEAEGVLRGGCLSMLAAAAGTPWALRHGPSGHDPASRGRATSGPIASTGCSCSSAPSGALDGVRGVVFGDMRGCAPQLREDYSLEDVLLEALDGLDVPDRARPVERPRARPRRSPCRSGCAPAWLCGTGCAIRGARAGGRVKVHLSGVCGTAMASLAGLLRERGHEVTGSDQDVYPPMSTQLEALGIAVRSPYAEGERPARTRTSW